jgi:hypothetical protein
MVGASAPAIICFKEMFPLAAMEIKHLATLIPRGCTASLAINYSGILMGCEPDRR